MRIYPAPHYTMGGLWVDYHLMSTIPGLFVLGEANFSDHGANRLGASALMQGLADGYFVIPYTLARLPRQHQARRRSAQASRSSGTRRPRSRSRVKRLLAVKGSAHRRRLPPRARQAHVGQRAACPAPRGPERGDRQPSAACARSSGRTSGSPARARDFNQELEKAGRVADFFELAELMCLDALTREESCGGHFREEHQTAEGEAQARRRELLPRHGVGVRGRAASRRSSTRSRSSSSA